ncbi:MAG: hypothetical protein WCF54_08110 [Terracidiphilus sp.]
MFGRIDDAKFQSGAAVLKNFVVTPTGAAKNRAGFSYVNATKENGVARLIPFTYSLNQTMVIELGNQYARFHANGETLQYSTTGQPAWVAPSGTISYSFTSPGVINWTGHGLTTGDPVRFYIYGSTTPQLPGGLQLDYTYTVIVIDANNFTLLDASGNPVNLTGTGSGGTPTNYPGTGTTTVTLNLAPNENTSTNSSILSGLANVSCGGETVTLNAGIQASIYSFNGGGAAVFQYSSDGVNWHDFYTMSSTQTTNVNVNIPLTNLNLLQLRVFANGDTGSSGSLSISAEISSWSVTVLTGGDSGTTPLRAYYFYSAGSVVSYEDAFYVATVNDSGGVTTPGTNPAVWYPLPADLTYEIPTPYLAADLFNIKYVQSADVMTLVHTNYPPQELKRLGATSWALTEIVFGPPLAAPQNPSVTASPGYLAQIASISSADPALIATVTNHTLALGDGVYLAGLGNQSNFYMVSKVPVDGSGNLIPNELYLMDYSGNNFICSSYSGGATLQFGTKIFNITNNYAVLAVASDGVSTGSLSSSVAVLNNLDVPGSYNTISWSAVTGAQTYYVYKQLNGLWGLIGSTQALTFVDNNIAPDMSLPPGTDYGVFSGEGNYPGAVAYFQQRRCFGGTLKAPQNVWMSNSGTESMFNYSLPSLSTDAVVFRVAAQKADAVLHIIPMLELILLTSESEFALDTAGNGAVTPSTISVNPQSYVGASQVQPTIINVCMVYAAARGGHVLSLGYAWTVNGYQPADLSLRAAHLFDNLTIVDQAYSKSPWPIVWFVSSNGNLVGLTYIPEEQLVAWHHHETDGVFESIASVAEGSEDVLYAVVNRTINRNTVRYVERMASRVIDSNDSSTWFFVDAGISQSFESPVTQVSGLTWLEGCTVAVLADGGVQSSKVVTGGSITLDHAASVITVGLPYVSDLQTLPATMQVDGFGQGRMKNINKAWVKVFQSSSILVGPDEDHLTEIRQRTNEVLGSPPALKSSELLVMTTPSWQEAGQILVRQAQPLPLEVVGMTLEVAIGG